MAAGPMLLVLQYDGSSFAGWQRQPAARTVQQEVERVLQRLAGVATPVVAAGRTDAGVHASGQAAAAAVPDRWTAGDLVRALNALLPSDVWIASARRMVPGFNPRRHAIERTYAYRVGTDRGAASPFRYRYEWAVGQALDEVLLCQAARCIVGTHGFRALALGGRKPGHDRCRVLEARWERRDGMPGYEFWITADRFLHRMVRFLVGTIVDIARGRRPLGYLEALLSSADNRIASRPAPACGLFLVNVRYPPHLYLDAP